MNSAIFWNGSSASTPILFNFSNVQPEVVRGVAYNDNLDAQAGPGITLTYDQTLNTGIFSQPQGFTIDPNTGAMNILAASTTLANYPDNGLNAGADKAFSGNIKASDGSFVEFEWLFDAVATAGNLAPSINDIIINALVGDNLNAVITAVDDGLPTPPGALSWTDVGLLGGLGSCSNAPIFNTATQTFSWNTSNCAAGSYLYQVQTSDGQKTDFGTITVNLSARQLADPASVGTVTEALAEAGLDAQRLVLEITETVLMQDREAAAATLWQLKALGVRIAIDDFGTGYSSLAYLRRFPIDMLKIAREFVDGLGRDEHDDVITRAIVELAGTLGLLTVAEGIETHDQQTIVTALGCDLGQGYLFSVPLDADAAMAVLTAAPLAVPHPRPSEGAPPRLYSVG